MFEKLHIKITILAALIATAYCIIFSLSFTNSCFTIIVTISVFYIISGFISMNLKNFKEELDKQNLEQTEDLLESNNMQENEETQNLEGNLQESLEDTIDN